MSDADQDAAPPSAPVALVTGASRGFGYAVARRLGASGMQIVALARTAGALEELADAIVADGGPNPTLVPLSLADEAGLQRLAMAIAERWGRLDLVVHAAAHAAPLAPAPHIGGKDFDQSLDVNLRGTERLIVLMQPLLAAAPDGHFVHISDDRAGQAFFGSYGATKAGADAIVRSWAAENARIKPRVSLFYPKPMPTALRARFFPGNNSTAVTSPDDEAARLITEFGL